MITLPILTETSRPSRRELKSERIVQRKAQLRADETHLKHRQTETAGERHSQLRFIRQAFAQLDILDALQSDSDLPQVDRIGKTIDRNQRHLAAIAFFVVELNVECAVTAFFEWREITDRDRKLVFLLGAEPGLYLSFRAFFGRGHNDPVVREQLLQAVDDFVSGAFLFLLSSSGGPKERRRSLSLMPTPIATRSKKLFSFRMSSSENFSARRISTAPRPKWPA